MRSTNIRSILTMLLMTLAVCPIRYGYAEDVEAVIHRLYDINSEVRGKAAGTLGEMKDPRAVEPLIAALKDKDPSVRWKAAEALGRIRDARAIEPLIAALRDENHSVRKNAVKALGKIGVPAVEPLLAELRDNDPSVRWKAAEALGEIGEPAIDPLIAALRDRDKDRNAQLEVLWVLALIGKNPAKETINHYAKTNQIDLDKIAHDYQTLIKEGTAGTEYLLTLALEMRGDATMAQHFLSCGNPLLEAAGRIWADRRGYQLRPLPDGKTGPVWGSK